MKIRHYGDLHLDRDLYNVDYFSSWELCWFPEVQKNEKKQTLILTGDLADSLRAFCLTMTGVSWLNVVSRRFKYVIVVLGNHDIYDEDLLEVHKKAKDLIKSDGLDNVFLLENEHIELDGVKFFGSTFWTDYNNRNPMDEMNCNGKLRDFYVIRNGANTQSYFEQNYKARLALTEFLKLDGKKVVVTHHAPSEQSSILYKGGKLNFAFVNTGCEHFFEASDLRYWFHGHTHEPIEYKFLNTVVSSNPRGYRREELLIHHRLYDV